MVGFQWTFKNGKNRKIAGFFRGFWGSGLFKVWILVENLVFKNSLPKGRASRSWPASGRCSSVVYNKRADRCLIVVIRRVVRESWKSKWQLIVRCYKNRLDRGLRKKIRCMNHMYGVSKGRASRSWPAGGRCSSVVNSKKGGKNVCCCNYKGCERIMEEKGTTDSSMLQKHIDYFSIGGERMILVQGRAPWIKKEK